MTVQAQIEKMREAPRRAMSFVGEVWAELKKVHWPSRKDTYVATIIVLIVTLIVATFLGLVDFAVSHVVRVLLS